jgi:hypothetical protein
MPSTRTIKLAALAAVLLTSHPIADGAARGRATGPGIEDLRFMSGCWHGTFESEKGAGTIEEHYTDPASNLMLGTTRYLRGGEAVEFEFSAIRRDDRGVWLTPYPGGVASPDAFRLTSVEGGRAVFEAPEHDYPKRILYRRDADGTLNARIDAGADDPAGSEWRMTPAPCAAASAGRS